MESRAFLKNVLERMQVSSTAMVGHKKCMLLLFLKILLFCGSQFAGLKLNLRSPGNDVPNSWTFIQNMLWQGPLIIQATTEVLCQFFANLYPSSDFWLRPCYLSEALPGR